LGSGQEMQEQISNGEWRSGRTADGDVRQAPVPANGDGVGEEAEERLGDHGQVGGGLEDLQRGGGDAHAVLEEEVDAQPREQPEPLHPESDPDHEPPPRLRRGSLRCHLLLLLHGDPSSSSPQPSEFKSESRVGSAPPDPRGGGWRGRHCELVGSRTHAYEDTSKGGGI
jgi:hypothetical protein